MLTYVVFVWSCLGYQPHRLSFLGYQPQRPLGLLPPYLSEAGGAGCAQAFVGEAISHTMGSDTSVHSRNCKLDAKHLTTITSA